MNRDTLSGVAKWTLILAGAACVTVAGIGLPGSALSSGFGLIVVFAMVAAPRMTLTLPRSRFAISFSDASIFLAFLFYGGEAAMLVAALESLGNCLYLRSLPGFTFGRMMIPVNVSINTVSFAITYAIWSSLTGLGYLPAGDTPDYLMATLGTLAIVHFAVSSALVSIVAWVIQGIPLWETWRQDCLTSAITHIVGGGLAGLVFKLVSFGDVITGVIAFVAFGIAYLSYRQSIGEMNEAILQAESAEREKAEGERIRRREAEEYAERLSHSLAKEERANEALRKSEKDLQHAAHYDSLTDLPNRKFFADSLRKLIEEYQNDPSKTFHVLFLDIRKFKHINDSLGHAIGDKVLMVAAKRFVKMLNSDDIVARLGGDEFAVILKDLATVGKAQKVARRIFDSVAQPFTLSGHRISISVNIGIAPCDTEYSMPEEVLRDADIAMHYAKEKGGGVAVFTRDLRVRFIEKVRFEDDLRNALDSNELWLSYQPIVSLDDGSTLGFEALLRWNHPEHGQVPPSKFIPVAEESGLIVPITHRILEDACRQIARWQKTGKANRGLLVSVNISGKHLSNDDLIDSVENALAVTKIRPSTLKLEITESAAMDNPEHTVSVLNRLKALGVKLSIDDFGTGYSSLSHLHKLPFDTLKVDRSFVSRVGEHGEGSEILQTIISLAKSLGKEVIAEGIETEAQLAVLRNLGCEYGQGYLFAKPQTGEAIETVLYEGRRWGSAINDRAEEREKLPVREVDRTLRLA